MSELLDGYLADPGDGAPRAVRLASGEIGYVEPIRMKGLCMRCHGDRIEPAVEARLRELYPDVRVKLLYKRDYQKLLFKFGVLR